MFFFFFNCLAHFLNLQRDEDEVLWAGVMGVPLNDESTALSGYAFEYNHNNSDSRATSMIDLFTISHQMREERERVLHNELHRLSVANPMNNLKLLTNEEQLQVHLGHLYTFFCIFITH